MSRGVRNRRRFPCGAYLAIALVLGGCGGAVATTSGPIAATDPLATPAGTIPPPVTFGPPPSPTPDDEGSPLIIDATLLDVLPADVGGVPIIESLDEASTALGDPALQGVATAIDAAVAVDSATGNVVYALVVRLRPDVLGDAAFRDWRDTYDQGACAAGGMVIGHAEADIDGRTVYIGTCEGGFRTYHVRLDPEGIVISAWSLGEGRFGELLMSNLRVGG